MMAMVDQYFFLIEAGTGEKYNHIGYKKFSTAFDIACELMDKDSKFHDPKKPKLIVKKLPLDRNDMDFTEDENAGMSRLL